MEYHHSVNEDPLLGTMFQWSNGPMIINNGETTNDIPNLSFSNSPLNATRQPSVSVMTNSLKDLSVSQMLRSLDGSPCFEEQEIPYPITSPGNKSFTTIPGCQIKITKQPELRGYKFR